MAPRYLLTRDFSDSDGLVSYSPHWVLGFARYANPITYDPVKRASVTKDLSFAYLEKDPLIVDDRGDCTSITVSASKGSHNMAMQATLLDSGTKYLNEVLPGDWVVAYMVYSEDELHKISDALSKKTKMNDWNSGLKFIGRVEGLQKTVTVAADGRTTSAYSLSCVAFKEFDAAVMYYPEMSKEYGIADSMEKFGPQVSNMIRGKECDERGALDPNTLIPRLMTVIFGHGAWAGIEFREGQALAPNVAYIVPKTVCSWLGVNTSKGNFSDLMRVLIGIQKYSTPAATTNDNAQPGSLFWPDGAKEAAEGYACPFKLMGSFPQEVVPQTTTTPWSFITNYVGAPVNEALVTLRPDTNGDIFPFFTVRQTPYTSEVGQQFSLEEFQIEQSAMEQKNSYEAPWLTATSHVVAPWATRLPTTRFLELPRWVVHDSMLNESSFGRSDTLRQNLVYVYGTGPGVAFDQYDQFIRSGPVLDQLDILRNGIRPYMPSVNCYISSLIRTPTDWRELMADIVMGQHLTLSGSMSVFGIRSPIAPGDNVEFQGVVYHIENVSHACSISPDGQRSFTTRLAVARGLVDKNATAGSSEERAASFPNTNSTDPEGPPLGITKD